MKTQSQENFRPLKSSDLIFLALSIALGVVPALIREVEPTAVAFTSLAAVIVGAGLPLLAPMLRLLGVFLAVIGGAILLARLSFYLTIDWYLSALVGGAVASHLRYLQRRVARATKGPVNATALQWPGVRMLWDEGEHNCEVTEPAIDVVLGAVRALNGVDRTAVSILRGVGRLDVAGNAKDAVMVYQTDDRSDHRVPWRYLATSGAPGDEVQVMVAGTLGYFRRNQTTSIAVALTAAQTYLSTGQHDPKLDWLGGRETEEMRPLSLQATD